MKICNEIKIIREITGLSQADLAKALNVSRLSIINWENGNVEVEENNIEVVYEFAYKNKIYLNRLYEMNYIEEIKSEINYVIFHGAKGTLQMPLDLDHSKPRNDFGKGVYFGEELYQAGTFISEHENGRVYIFEINMLDLNIVRFKVSKEWMIAVAYYRGLLDNYSNHKVIKNIIKKVEDADLIIAPIADNKMYNIINQFVLGEITDEQCSHALSATDLGNQYVVRTEKALEKMYLLKECYVSKSEMKEYDNIRSKISDLGLKKVKLARIEYKGKGKYIDEVLS